MDIPVFTRINKAIRTQRIDRAFGINALCEVLEAYMPEDDVALVRRAYDYGANAHSGQYRKSGEAYIYHPLAVAQILAHMNLDAVTIAAAILHDVIEDTDALAADLASRFGQDVAHIVEGVSKLDRASDQSRETAQAQSLRKLLLAMTDDIRVILVKLADRLHNMRTLGAMQPEKRRRIAQETLDIYAPIAQRLGIQAIRTELEDLGFSNLYPMRYRVLNESVERLSNKRKNLIREVETRLSRALSEEGIGAAVFGRRKNLYSTYRKMQSKHLHFLDVMDLYGFRIIVESDDACYRALGVAHSVYRPVAQLFDDYIANPKVNGYQSLHSTLVGPRGVKIEVQIRTREMNQVAEAGVAAHWLYKINSTKSRLAAPQQRARAWLDNLMSLHAETPDSEDFVENVRVDLFPDEIYVFSPKGRIVRLPKRATPVDFAYAIHTELGNTCVAARVDGRLASLATPLQSGMRVEIITAKHQQPNAVWLNSVRTAKARSAILHKLRHQRDDEARKLGRRLLQMGLRQLGSKASGIEEERVEEVLATLGVDSMDALYEQIGRGKRLAPVVARQLLAADADGGDGSHGSLQVTGTEGMVLEYARCCRPIPGDAIRGKLSSGRGIVIHRRKCTRGDSRKEDAGDVVDVVWADDIEGEYPVEVVISCTNRRGMLASVATAVSDAQSSVDRVNIYDRSGEVTEFQILCAVRNRVHLARILRALRRITGVERVERGPVEPGRRMPVETGG
ncbi:MAG: bifunctional (p)ppGpp synthetase/guanosine-3',5'-bis(diphosphate) 3'-pyrophosphohydrolase [Oceanococcaceae bacterium]